MKLRRVRSTLALLPGVILLAHALAPGTCFADSLISDPGLEERDTSWNLHGGAAWTEENPHGGKTAVDLSRGENDSFRLLMSAPLSWKPHSVYKTTFWARSIEGPGIVRVNFWGPHDSDGKYYEGAQREVRVRPNGKWRRFEVVLEITEADPGRDIRLRVWTPLPNPQKTFVDDVQLEFLRTIPIFLDKESLVCLSDTDEYHAANPRLTVDAEGDLWSVWVSHGPESDAVYLAGTNGSGERISPFRIPTGSQCECPLVAPMGKNILLAWIEITPGGEWQLRTTRANESVITPPVTVWSGPGKAHNPVLASSPDGAAWLAWEVYGGGESTICVANYGDNEWGRPFFISEKGAHCYDPALAVDPEDGSARVAYACSKEGYTDIRLVSLEPGKSKPGSDLQISDSGWAFSPAVALDKERNVWVAWEYQRGALRRPDDFATIGEVFDKDIQAAVVRDGKILRPHDPKNGNPVPVSIGGNSQRPALVPLPNGRIALLSRLSEETRRTWNIRASLIDPETGKVSEPVKLLIGVELGRKDDCVAVPRDEALYLTWQGDDYLTRQSGTVRSDVYLAPLDMNKMMEKAAWHEVDWQAPGSRGGKRPRIVPDRSREKIDVRGQEYTLYWGTLHEHTDYSRCAKGHDGSRDDNYRLNLDVEGYDFATLTDHGYDLDTVAWKGNNRIASFYNDPGYFVTFPAYEWTQSPAFGPVTVGYGHRNVFFASDADAGEVCYNCFMEETDRIGKLWDLLRGRDVITIPHHPADKQHPMDWYRDDELQPLVEIFQGRGSAEHAGAPRVTRNLTDREGCYVHDALKRDFHLGFVASGDHVGPGSTGIYAKSLNRRDLMEALRNRRCFATTEERIVLDFRVDGHIMGERLSLPENKKIEITACVGGTDTLQEIVVFRDCEIFHRLDANELKGKKTARFSLPDTVNDNTYYYLRVVQEDDEVAWASPIWLTIDKP